LSQLFDLYVVENVPEDITYGSLDIIDFALSEKTHDLLLRLGFLSFAIFLFIYYDWHSSIRLAPFNLLPQINANTRAIPLQHLAWSSARFLLRKAALERILFGSIWRLRQIVGTRVQLNTILLRQSEFKAFFMQQASVGNMGAFVLLRS